MNSKAHLESEDCKRFAEIKRNRRIDSQQEAATNVKFNINGEEINTVSSFKYLGSIITDTNDDLEAIDLQLKKARMTWGRIGKIIKKKDKWKSKNNGNILQSNNSIGAIVWLRIMGDIKTCSQEITKFS